jgi:small GTP-binding protein
MAHFKVVITGPFNAGKTSFIRTVNEIRGVNTDVSTEVGRHVKPQTTVAMDFGRVTLRDGLTLQLFGTPGQERFAFLWEMLTIECHGIVLLVDSRDAHSLADAGKMIDFFAARAPGVPIIVVANKQDLSGALSPQELAGALNLVGADQAGRAVAILPPPRCVAEDAASVLAVLEKIIPYLAAGRPNTQPAVA